jgi:hypothetical protein
MAKKRCGWFSRLWHARLRRIDRRLIVPATLERAGPDKAWLAWLVLLAAPGNKHWTCACSAPDRDDVWLDFFGPAARQ